MMQPHKRFLIDHTGMPDDFFIHLALSVVALKRARQINRMVILGIGV